MTVQGTTLRAAVESGAGAANVCQTSSVATDTSRLVQRAVKLAREGDHRGALKVLYDMVASRPDDNRVWLRIGDLHVELGETGLAIEAYVGVADRYREVGFMLKAIAVRKQVATLDPTRAENHLALGEIYCQVGMDGEAIRALERAAHHAGGPTGQATRNEALSRLLTIDPFHAEARLLSGESPPTPIARNAELERVIASDPDNDDAFLVYGDWLQAHGDPRGELASLQHALPPELDVELARQMPGASPPLSTSASTEVELGEQIMAFQVRHKEYLTWHLDSFVDLRWHLGFIQSATIGERSRSLSAANSDAVLRSLLDLPAAPFMRGVAVEEPRHVEALMAAGKPPLLRDLAIVNSPFPQPIYRSAMPLGTQFFSAATVSVDGIGRAFPGLQTLRLYAYAVHLGNVACPGLRQLEIMTGPESKEPLLAFAGAEWPVLRSLRLCAVDPNPDDMWRALAGKRLHAVQELGLTIERDVGVLAQLPVLSQLRCLTLYGWLPDTGVEELVAQREAFAHLDRFDVLAQVSDEAAQHLQALHPRVRILGMDP